MKHRNKNKAMPFIIKPYVNLFHPGGKENKKGTVHMDHHYLLM